MTARATYTTAQMIETLRALARGKPLGYDRYEELSKGRALPSARAIYRRFGSWTGACAAAGIQSKAPRQVEVLDLPDDVPSLADLLDEDVTDDIPTPPCAPVRGYQAAHKGEVKRYLITWAQNATPVEPHLWDSLQQYARHRDAQIVVVPGRYKNPTSRWTMKDEADDWYDDVVVPYLLQDTLHLPGISVHTAPIVPTAVTPLTGFEVFAGAHSAVFGHPKIQLTTLPVAGFESDRVLYTTGACTIPSYTDSKAGRKAEPHHILGALVIETDGKIHLARHISACGQTGVFVDLDTEYRPDGVGPAEPAAVIVPGDIHHESLVPEVWAATCEMVDQLQAREIHFHDTLSFAARNHHDRQDPNRNFERAVGTRLDVVEDEVDAVIRFLDSAPTQAVVIPSNHDNAFDRWLKDADPRTDPTNARYWCEVRAAQLREYEQSHRWVPALQLEYQRKGAGGVRFADGQYLVDGVLNLHGHQGVNGARPSLQAYAKLGLKINKGHGHSPSIRDGVVQSGMSGNPDQGYNNPPSSWAHTNIVQYSTGKRALLFIRGGRWHL